MRGISGLAKPLFLIFSTKRGDVTVGICTVRSIGFGFSMLRKDKGREYFVFWVDKLKKYVYNIVESSFLRTNENIESSQKRTKEKRKNSLLRTNRFLK